MEGVSKVMKEDYKPRAIDRVMFGILSVVLILSGAYLVGPWYIDVDAEGKAPLYNLFNDNTVVIIFGYALLVTGLLLGWSAVAKATTKFYTAITSTALLSGFLLRLYSLIGVFITLESWRPPSYLSHLATVVMCGSYWVWVKVNVRGRPTQ